MYPCEISKQSFFSPSYYQRSINALNIALETTPAYQKWRQFDPGRRAAVDMRYAAMPELTKHVMRECFPNGLVPGPRKVEDGLHTGEIEYVQTSGTTAEKVTNLWNQKWWNASEAASWRLNIHTAHMNHAQREAQLTSALSVGIRSEQDLSMRERTLGRLLFLNEKVSAREWQARHYERMAAELAEFQPALLEANPSFLARLAWWASDNQRQMYQPQAITLTYELPSAIQLREIRKVFSTPLISSFGSTETGYVLMQCEYGAFHQNTEFCRIDFQPLKIEHGGPYLGRILVTTFNNPWTAVVRFDVGDLVRLSDLRPCACGRNEGYLVAAIEGRTANVTFTTRGNLVTTKAVDDTLSAIQEIRDYKLEQMSHTEYVVKLLFKGNVEPALEQTRSVLRQLYGADAAIEIEVCDDIEPGPSGKYRRTRATFKFDEKGLFV